MTRLVITALCAFVLGLGCASSGPLLHPSINTLGYAKWDCGRLAPEGWVSHALVLSDVELAISVARHEQKHIDQMLAYGSCEEFKKAWNADPSGMVKAMEAEAYCVSARESLRRKEHDNLEDAIQHFAYNLHAHYGLDLTIDEAADEIRSYCTNEGLPLWHSLTT